MTVPAPASVITKAELYSPPRGLCAISYFAEHITLETERLAQTAPTARKNTKGPYRPTNFAIVAATSTDMVPPRWAG